MHEVCIIPGVEMKCNQSLSGGSNLVRSRILVVGGELEQVNREKERR